MGRRSSNIEDRRGMGGGMGLPIVGGGLGTVVLVLLAMFFGVDPGAIIGTGEGPAQNYGVEAPASPRTTDTLKDFVSVVLADTEDTWRELFRGLRREYREPTLVLFSGSVHSACGMAGSAVGPFYCPRDQKIYIDLAFFQDLGRRFGAPGDFAQAYVIAHEVGHHVQNLLGLAAIGQGGRGASNDVSVRRELQADCFAGIWAHHAERSRQVLETGDIDEALGAAAAVGDDRLQKRAQGHIAPESFTHGSSAQRARWFKRGFESGEVARCDTFRAREL
ncbi:MAG TPA: neutral zinc metallopeptidase [Terriglobales bacterium]|nr:neutral zinc metallopeptidase [Terriglobales bacterium]